MYRQTTETISSSKVFKTIEEAFGYCNAVTAELMKTGYTISSVNVTYDDYYEKQDMYNASVNAYKVADDKSTTVSAEAKVTFPNPTVQ